MDLTIHPPIPAADLSAFDDSGELNAIIDTPKGSRNKYKLDERRKCYRLGKVLPLGAVFPFDFGFVPSTLGGDGDPLDVLVLMDEAAFTGCLVPSRLVGVLEAEQTENGETEENHRVIAVASASHEFKDVKDVADLPKHVLDEIEHFFVSYHEIQGRRFEVQRRSGPKRARTIVDEAGERFVKEHDPGWRRVGRDAAAREPRGRRGVAARESAEPKSHRVRDAYHDGGPKRFGGPR